MLQNILFCLFAIPAFLFGLFLFYFPLKAFAIQKKFYALINWRIEPISLQKEIRNTKIMGIFLILYVLAATFYLFLMKR